MKICDNILRKFPDHGETMSIKAFALRSLYNEKKEESYELAKKGLSKDIRSYICWHVYAILLRSDRDYQEAAKAMKFTLRSDKENVHLLTDYAHCLIQIRDYNEYREIRRQLLTLKPSAKVNWMAYAIAHHLKKDYDAALEVLDLYNKAVEASDEYETSELLLFGNLLMEEKGDYERALNNLTRVEKHIPDKQHVNRKKVDLLTKLGRDEEAIQVIKELLKVNPEDLKYHEQLRQAHGLLPKEGKLDDTQIDKLAALYDELASEFPSYVTSVQRIPLDFLKGDRFREALDKYVRPRIRKGKPSLFVELKPLYNDPEKVVIIEELLLQHLDSLRTEETFKDPYEKDPDPESPTCLLFTLFFLAQHFDKRRQPLKALEYLEEAIDHTPTFINLYVCKGLIYKHCGDSQRASMMLEKARELDLADRYLNSKSAKYLLRADKVLEAELVMALFTKDSSSQNNLYEMQSSRSEQEIGDSFFRQGLYKQALEQYQNIDKHFEDFKDDQFDFHSYCLRKMTLRPYLQLLEWEDSVESHLFFFKACCGIVKCYLAMYEQKQREAEANRDEEEMLDEAQKKELSKKRRAEARAGKKATTEEEVADVDYLAEATKYVHRLRASNSDKIQTHLLAFDVFLKREKYLLALQAIKRAIKVDPGHPGVHRMIIMFFNAVDSAGQLEDHVKEVIDAERQTEELGSGASLAEINTQFLNKNAESIAHRTAAAEMMYLLCKEHRDDAIKLMQEYNTEEPVEKGFERWMEAEKFLREVLKADDSQLEAFISASPDHFPPNFSKIEEEEQQKNKLENEENEKEESENDEEEEIENSGAEQQGNDSQPEENEEK